MVCRGVIVVPACENPWFYQASQQSEQNFDVFDNDFGNVYLSD